MAAYISVASGCLFGDPVCGKLRNTTDCRTFRNKCKFNVANFFNSDYEEVDIKFCNKETGGRSTHTCLTVVPTTTTAPPTTPWTCGRNCKPLATEPVCTYKLNANPDTCRKFRNPCEFENHKCAQNPQLYDVADLARCSTLTSFNVDGNCV